MRRQLFALGLAVAGVVSVSACNPMMDKVFRDDAALTAKVTSVRLDGMKAGSVTVVGGTAKPSLARTIHYKDNRPEGPTHRIENGVLVLSGCGMDDCSVSYDIKVPAGLPVSGGTTSGSIHLSHVGQVNVTGHSGEITLDDVAGPVVARTHNGRIKGAGISGKIDAETSNGAIDLTPSKAESVRAKTTNGAITLTVPKDGRYQVTSHTSNGGRDIGVQNDPSAANRLDLTTSNGHIEVRAA
ncbi:DUF4097 family beta strand repeat-containing protein [Actinomadura harenae]|uniref:DUF4097 domain-containing protein n=1 Tax=Actinomadura harenae TaxID=2483351 RepID=A0A3M2LX75_9ACTN|nr:DUF4097 family beta strand repeat-containing protein [Actinomadura harenae]RMI41510.1 hypothetical protein EBO15_23095 [Actinomadura harenae]